MWAHRMDISSLIWYINMAPALTGVKRASQWSECYHSTKKLIMRDHAPLFFVPQPQCRSICLVLCLRPSYLRKLQNRIPAGSCTEKETKIRKKKTHALEFSAVACKKIVSQQVKSKKIVHVQDIKNFWLLILSMVNKWLFMND